MANSAGLVKESIWRDRDFRALPRCAQATYVELLSQKELDRAGMLPLQATKWAKGCDEITEADIWHDLKVLQERRFVFFDEDTDEAFVRSYMRQTDVVRYPNILKNALRCATMVASEVLRRELAAELRRLRRADATRVADEIEPEPSDNPSETVPEPNENPTQTVPERLNGSETPPEPQGVGEGVGEGSVPEVVTAAASNPNHEQPQQQPTAKPIDELKSALRAAKLTASWTGIRAAEHVEVTELIAAHGIPALVQAAVSSHWANNPAKSFRAWLPAWQDLVTGSAPPTRPDWCGECDESTRQRVDDEQRPYRCPDCHPLREVNRDA